MSPLAPVAGWALAALCIVPAEAHAWGDEGHEIIGLIAEHYLTPAARSTVEHLLAGDDTGLVTRDLAHEATWADKYRDSDRDGARLRYNATRDWHFVDLEIRDGPDLNSACHGRPRLPQGTPASRGPAHDCVIDKIEQFSAELADPRVDEAERRLALQFLLHLVGDLHQPLHASDDHDQGGNRKLASGPGFSQNNLHHDWDVVFLERLGPGSAAIARSLIARVSEAELLRWSRGTPDEWALETFAVAKQHAYGLLPARSDAGIYRLSEAYATDASAVSAQQLTRAGVRLAALLNRLLR